MPTDDPTPPQPSPTGGAGPTVQVLHIEECPNWAEAGAMIRRALDAAGHAEVDVEYVVLQTRTEAAAVAFAGSPTILVDGVDLFPGRRTDDLACRVYRTDRGLAGLPTQDQVDEAIRTRLRPTS
ncbi:hypothetical protein [Raineyella sp. LH-20]|uniref:DF family (seleno)protein n=1 Tax=Raineyella sp. LH-20 TaxID=3081204 RepID=UPI0029535620|nr:hypothetical protein [Raineyella sp. LH-20]WOP17572.1 hypothetical protein R0146_09830 [Raineyella sp. LH-20]